MLGLLLELGPILVNEDGGVRPNEFSWDKLVDYIWVDQPVYVSYSHPIVRESSHSNGLYLDSGVGYATSDSSGYGT